VITLPSNPGVGGRRRRRRRRRRREETRLFVPPCPPRART